MAEKKHAKLLIALTGVALGMFAFGFALVPLYKSLCSAFGINGKIELKASPYQAGTIIQDREVTVEFVATNYGSLPWAFYPKVTRIKIQPGNTARLSFYAENKSNHRMTVQAIPSVTPGIAAKYLKKTECFCFTQQTLNGHEAMNMPLLFHLDPSLPNNIKTITLSYTLFDVTRTIMNS